MPELETEEEAKKIQKTRIEKAEESVGKKY